MITGCASTVISRFQNSLSLSLHSSLTIFAELLKMFNDDDDLLNFEYLSASLTIFILKNMVDLLIPVIRGKNLFAIYCVSVQS